MTEKSLLNVSRWNPTVCTRLSFLAYLRPKESLRANTRWIFGVELKTQTEKPQDAENLKAAHIVFLQQRATLPIRY